MMACSNVISRYLAAVLLLLLMATGFDVAAQNAQSSVPAQTEAARVPPPGDDDPSGPPFNAAVMLNQSVQTTMTAGTMYTVIVNMKNTGNTTWSSSAAYRLGSSNPMDNWTWGGIRVPLQVDIPPGGIAQFTFQVTAPSTPGNYNFQWRMVQDGVEWFGAASSNLVISVGPPPSVNDAAFISQSVPSSMTAGTQYTVSVNMLNTGNTTWTMSDPYALGSFNPENNTVWGTARGWLAANVAPGQTGTFTFVVTAPSVSGSIGFQWRMLQSTCCWFGAPSTNVAVAVTAPPTNGAQFVSQNVPATMVPGQVYPVTIVMQNTGTSTWTAHGDRGLASANPLANNIWNMVRIDQPTTTAPGQTASYTFQVTAPATPGSYNFQWKMVQDQIEWFGAESPNLSIQVAAQADTVTYIHTDALGSPVARSDSAGNVIVGSRTSYEPYGRTASGAVPTIGFTGHVNDADTGLVYMQQRYYDPVAGRFLSVDPVTTNLKNGLGFNRYAYANNSPFKYIDPDGRDSVITTMRDGSIKIQIPIQFTGAGATAANISAAKQDIQSKWSGTYTVGGSEKRIVVEVVDQRTDGKLNTITLTTGLTSIAGGASFVRGGNSGEWNTASAGVPHGEMAHEGGHLMGASDHYSTTTGENGERITSPTEGFSGNIMGQLPGTVSQSNITEIMGSNANVRKVEPPEEVR